MRVGDQMMKKTKRIIAIAFMLVAMLITVSSSALAGWSSMTSVTSEYLLYLWGSSGSDVFAVGVNGTIVHYDGSNWSAMSSGTTEALFNVWGSSASDVYAVGSSATMLHYNGSSWSSIKSATSNYLEGVWGSSASDVYVVGWHGTILHYNGTSWSTMNSGTTNSLYGIWGNSGSDIFAVGEKGTIIHYNGTNWSTMNSGITQSLFDIWGSSGTDVFAVGWSGDILHYDGTSWSTMNSGSISASECIWGSSATDVFAIDTFDIVHYDGSTWTTMYSYPYSTLSAIWGSSGSDVFAVGNSGTILHYDGTPSPTTTTTAGSSSTTTISPSAFTIAGTIIGDISANVHVELLGDDNQIVDTDNMGHYEFPNLNAGGFYLIIPQLAGYDFDPPQHEIPNLMGDELNMDFLAIKTGPCVAKVIYGKASEEVELLRYVRDNVLSQTPEGREIIKLYYHWSPVIVKAMEKDEEFEEDMKGMIDGVLGFD